MGAFSGEAWVGLMEKIQQSQNSGEISDKDLEQAFLSLQRLLERKARIFWHKRYFNKYIDNKIVPWGLRVPIFPNIRKVEESLKSKWEENLQSCSFGMMDLLFTQYEHELGILDESVLKWYNDHGLISNSAKFKKKENELKIHLERYTLKIINTKESKFARDTNAHLNGSAYKWTQNTNTRPYRSTSQRNTRNENDMSNLSPSSSLSSSQSTVYRDLSEDRLSKKHKGNSDTASTESLKRQTGT